MRIETMRRIDWLAAAIITAIFFVVALLQSGVWQP
jgi:hypothetical protein